MGKKGLTWLVVDRKFNFSPKSQLARPFLGGELQAFFASAVMGAEESKASSAVEYDANHSTSPVGEGPVHLACEPFLRHSQYPHMVSQRGYFFTRTVGKVGTHQLGVADCSRSRRGELQDACRICSGASCGWERADIDLCCLGYREPPGKPKNALSLGGLSGQRGFFLSRAGLGA